ncbi:probable receptor-like serine/threonine-protein kinase At5g57670 [Cryptomeria japonica]|uniref:probable receptor-like serine/threonine-protein kinase At5g57670 n=1 Tax=Cryptomeria japonica TaxID=3369 RepID=UPI0027DAA252|nr:probable receptor-like serine/threonine-protein kinase At5g57670 [Cryptomeria japonica]
MGLLMTEHPEKKSYTKNLCRKAKSLRSFSRNALLQHSDNNPHDETHDFNNNCSCIWRNITMKLLLQNYSFKNLFSRRAKYNEDSSSSAASSYMELKDKDEGNVSADEIPIPMPAIPPPLWKPSWRCFAFDEVCGATNNFHADNLVGRGGYAEVYKGALPDGQMIAVKRLAKGNTDEQKEKEFLTELGIIGHVCHPNATSLIGCCIENGLHLIFDYYVNGSLASLLHGTRTPVLEWSIRYKVAIGTARGLHYLHKCCQRRIIHRDIKASNVLLGTDFEPQISDFGLAKWLPTQWTHHSVTPIEGTFGYLAPEYFLHGIVDEKTDVFAFGVLLLEIISGRRPIDASEKNLVSWAKPLLESGNIHELVDPRLRGQYDSHQMQRMVFTASLCIRHSAIWRPSMIEVLQLLIEGQSHETADSWKMPPSIMDEDDDDFWGFDESESEIDVTDDRR